MTSLANAEYYFTAVKKCLEQFHGYNESDAIALLAEFYFRATVNQNFLLNPNDLLFETEPFELACDLSNQVLDHSKFEEKYANLLSGLKKSKVEWVTVQPLLHELRSSAIKPKNIFEQWVPLEVLYPELDSTVESLQKLLSDLNLREALMWCFAINQLVSASNSTERVRQQLIAAELFIPEDRYKNVFNFARDHFSTFKFVFFRGQLLVLARYICLFSRDEVQNTETFSEPEIRYIFGKAALICSHLWERELLSERSSIPLDEAVRLSTPYLAGVSRGQSLHSILGRSYELIYKNVVETASVSSAFERHTGLTISEFYGCYFGLLSGFVEARNEYLIADKVIHLKQTAELSGVLKSSMVSFVEMESFTLEEFKNFINTTGRGYWSKIQAFLTERPIIRLDSNRYIVTDPRAYADQALVGPAKVISRTIDVRFLNKSFVNYCERILTEMFDGQKESTSRLYGKDLPWIAKVGLDAAFHHGKDVVFFESKCFWATEEIAKLLPSGSIHQSISKKVEDFNLAKAIKAIPSEGIGLPTGDFQRIVPIFIGFEEWWNSPGCQRMLVNNFLLSLGLKTNFGDGNVFFNGMQLLLPIVLTLNTLELLEFSLVEFDFLQLIEDYNSFDPNRTDNLYDFIATSKYRDKLKKNERLANSSEQMISRISQYFTNP